MRKKAEDTPAQKLGSKKQNKKSEKLIGDKMELWLKVRGGDMTKRGDEMRAKEMTGDKEKEGRGWNEGK